MKFTICFTSPLRVQEITNGQWVLTDDFVVTIDDKTVSVPKGFITDFASVPRLPFAYMMFGGIGNRPAVLHDYLYSIGGDSKAKEFADNVLYYGIMADGDSKWKAKAMYTGVRLFGGKFWKSKSENK
jgi:hypothetical protein